MTTFQNFGLPEELHQALTQLQFITPTPIQAQAIPLALEGRDIIGSAQTGTGKTAAFVLPLISKLMASKQETALVLTPTRELAMQVIEFVRKLLGKNNKIQAALLIGGDSMYKQISQLRANPRLIIGTPGRVNDHLRRRSLNLQKTSFLVLDEMDRMLDIGFGVQLEEIAKYLPKERQTLMFSATLPKNFAALSQKYLTNPERIAVGSTDTPSVNIKQESLFLSQAEKYTQLIKELDQRSGTVLIFAKTKISVEKLSKKLANDDYSSSFIHGDLRQSKRAQTIRSYLNKKYRILVATDVAARGLDIPHIEHVINYDLPQCPEDYIHRIGRTARAGLTGSALCFISPDEKRKWMAIQNLINPGQRSESPRFEGRSKSGKSRRFDDSPRFGKRGSSSERKFGGGGSKSRQRPWLEDKPLESRVKGPRSKSLHEEESDRPKKSWGKPSADRFYDKPEKSKKVWSKEERPTFGERPAKAKRFGSREERPSFGDRPVKSKKFASREDHFDFDDKPARPRKFSSKEDRPAFGGNGAKSKKFWSKEERPSFGDRPAKKKFGSKEERPSFGGKPSKSKKFGKDTFKERDQARKPFKGRPSNAKKRDSR